MDFFNCLFWKDNKRPRFWRLGRIFKQPKEEGISIEYKSGTKEPDTSKALYPILRAICGLLNSEGGINYLGGSERGKKEWCSDFFRGFIHLAN
jgi:hypothetical protein